MCKHLLPGGGSPLDAAAVGRHEDVHGIEPIGDRVVRARANLQPYVAEAATVCDRGCNHMSYAEERLEAARANLEASVQRGRVGVITREHTLRPRCSAGT